MGYPPILVMERLRDLHVACTRGKQGLVSAILERSFLVQDHSDCQCAFLKFTNEDQALWWIHENHRSYNNAQRAIISRALGLQVLAEIIKDDLVRMGNMAGCGEVFDRRHARWLSEHFVYSSDCC